MAEVRPTTVMTISLDRTETPGETQVGSPEGAEAQVDRLMIQVAAVVGEAAHLLEDLPEMEEVVRGTLGISNMGFLRLPASIRITLSCCWPGPAYSRPKY